MAEELLPLPPLLKLAKQSLISMMLATHVSHLKATLQMLEENSRLLSNLEEQVCELSETHEVDFEAC